MKLPIRIKNLSKRHEDPIFVSASQLRHKNKLSFPGNLHRWSSYTYYMAECSLRFRCSHPQSVLNFYVFSCCSAAVESIIKGQKSRFLWISKSRNFVLFFWDFWARLGKFWNDEKFFSTHFWHGIQLAATKSKLTQIFYVISEYFSIKYSSVA